MSVEVGSKIQGKVTGITNFGAFINSPPRSGISDNRSKTFIQKEISNQRKVLKIKWPVF